MSGRSRDQNVDLEEILMQIRWILCSASISVLFKVNSSNRLVVRESPPPPWGLRGRPSVGNPKFLVHFCERDVETSYEVKLTKWRL
jgi:hypothetical protein